MGVSNSAYTLPSDGEAEQAARGARAEASVLPRTETPLSINLNKSQVAKPPTKGIGDYFFEIAALMVYNNFF
jgi:hypothetical protein